MALPNSLRQVFLRPEMNLAPVEFDVAVAFIHGFDLANNGCLLLGFREWLVLKVGYGSNLAWPELALRLAIPNSDAPRQHLKEHDEQKDAVKKLFQIVENFWEERESKGGLRRIYLQHQLWLQTQDWYEASSPDWIEFEVNSLGSAAMNR